MSVQEMRVDKQRSCDVVKWSALPGPVGPFPDRSSALHGRLLPPPFPALAHPCCQPSSLSCPRTPCPSWLSPSCPCAVNKTGGDQQNKKYNPPSSLTGSTRLVLRPAKGRTATCQLNTVCCTAAIYYVSPVPPSNPYVTPTFGFKARIKQMFIAVSLYYDCIGQKERKPYSSPSNASVQFLCRRLCTEYRLAEPGTRLL